MDNSNEEELLSELLKKDLEDDIGISSVEESDYDEDDLMKIYNEDNEIPHYACEYCSIH